jgi:protein-L-isoaspartate(D-aspartate) O-methyltransferase
MFDFAQARRNMVEGQIRTADVFDLALVAAMLDVPRERFLPADQAPLAYLDLNLPVGPADTTSGRRLLTPMVLAKLIQAADIREDESVLDVGCATGYAAALLARLAGRVIALEEDPSLVPAAKGALSDLASGVVVVTGQLTGGWPEGAPYDVILLEGTTEIPPRAFFPQLRDGGRLLCVQGRNPGKAMLYRSVSGDFSGRPLFDAAAPLLPGFAAPPAFVF